MLDHVHNRFPITRLTHKSLTLSANASNVAVDISPLFHVCTVVVKSAPADATMKFGATSESAIPIVAGEVRSNLAVEALFLSSVTGGAVVLEVHGR